MNHPTKHIICLLAVLFVGGLAPGLLAGEDSNSLELDGREVTVRVYKDWREDPAAFERMGVKIEGRSAIFDFGDLGEFAVVAVLAADQSDEAVREVIGDRIYGWSYEEGLEFCLPTEPPDKQEDYLWTFKDALGNPLAGATVDICVGRKLSLSYNRGEEIFIGQDRLDEQGQLNTPKLTGELKEFSFTVSKLDYGTAVVDSGVVKQPHMLSVPLVPAGTKADERSIWGVVVDDANNPVCRAVVGCFGLSPAGGEMSEKVRPIQGQNCAVLTDEQGRFWMYLPIAKDEEKIGDMIPLKAKYIVNVRPPRGLGLLMFKSEIPNGQETTITLERGGYFRTFAFEDTNGPITNLNRLKKILFYVQRLGKPSLHFKYKDWKDGGMFPLGIYKPVTIGGGWGDFEFQAMEITADSPEKLVFKVRPSTLVYGQVVHGITSEPMEGAFVIGRKSICGRKNLSVVTVEQWDALHALPQSTSTSDKALSDVLKPVREVYEFKKIVRTNSSGWFEMQLPSREHIEGFTVFEENYLTVDASRYIVKPNENGEAAVPSTKLFPAATVIFKPCLSGEKYDPIRGKWLIDENDNPDWVRDFLATCEKRHLGTRRSFYIPTNTRQSCYVPAGLNLQIQFSNLRPGMPAEWSPVTIPAETINLQQGHTLDLGIYTFEPNQPVKIIVEVVNSAGEPVEGVPIGRWKNGNQWGAAHITNAEGIAQFTVDQHSSGEFVVLCYKDTEKPRKLHLYEALPYELGGQEDANNVYTLSLSDEMAYNLFK